MQQQLSLGSRPIEERFNQLTAARWGHLERARDCAALTLPRVLPPEGYTIQDQLPTPEASLGSRLVNNLISKLLLTLFPSNVPFFRLEVGDLGLLLELEGTPADESGELTLKDLQDEAFGNIERAGLMEFNKMRLRPAMGKILTNLVVTGSACWLKVGRKTKNAYRVFRLDNWVNKLSPEGDPVEIIVRETQLWETLSDESRALLKDTHPLNQKMDDKIPMFTRAILMNNGKWEVSQEIRGVRVSTTVYTEDSMPFRVAHWNRVDNEDYGIGEVEKNLGDFRTVESGTIIIKEGAAAASKVVFLVNPNGTVKAADLAEAPNGGFVSGSEGEVASVKADKYYDFRGLNELLALKTRDLSFAFLMNSAVQRQGERVTAEEIRLMAQELEDSFGATYASLAEQVQMPVALDVISRVKGAPKVVGSDEIQIVVSTGIEGLGRVHEINRLQQALQTISVIPNGTSFLKMQTLLRKILSLYGISHSSLIKSPMELQQEQQQAMMQQMALSATPNAVKGVADGLNQQNQQGE